MTIRVLHIFPPSLKTRFGGQNIYWQFVIAHWSDQTVNHTVLDTNIGQIIDAATAFNFTYGSKQSMTTILGRLSWTFSILHNLIKHRQKYDLLHVHVLWWGTLLLGPLAKWANKPTVFESVLLGEDTPSGIIHEQLGHLKLNLLRAYSGILAISDYLAEDYLKHGFSEAQVFTLSNSVDTELFNPCQSVTHKTELRQKLGLPVDAPVLLFVGSVIQRKGVDILVEAFIQAAKITPNLHMVIVGARNKSENPSLDEEFVSALVQELESSGLASQVKWGGLVQDRARLAEYYNSADLFVFPSRNEGLGNVVLEGMSAGLPVVVTQLPVLRNLIRDGENGLFVPVNDAISLKDAIIQLVENPQLAQKLGGSAREYVENNHSFQTWQNQITEYYRSILAGIGYK